ncbi:MAG: FHA domain-containing protein [Anaerolineae bacterium]|nr:FHA domain-containing protein [Anaerolineae bacterium]
MNNSPLLIIYKGSMAGSRWMVSSDSVTLGRARDCEVVLPEREVSRYHARIERDATGYVLRDLGSRNGTLVNGEAVRGLPYRLRDGDEIELAGALKLSFVAGEATLPLADLGLDGVDNDHIGQRLQVDQATRQVCFGRQILDPPLSPAQFGFLVRLIAAKGAVVTREEAVAAVWPEAAGGVTDQALDALVYRLRERLSELDPDHVYIATVRGHGFRFSLRP